MKKTEFLARLNEELQKRGVADAEDIVAEYAQHFDMKLADGYSEEEIAARLGYPTTLAAQFSDDEDAPVRRGGSRPLVVLGLGIADLFAGLFFVLLGAFGLVLAACAVSFGAVGVCFIGNLGQLVPGISLPPTPYWCGAELGLSLLALCALSVAGCVWFFAFVGQTVRAYGRFHQNTLAQSRGGAVLPGLPLAPQLLAKTKRRLRSLAMVSLALFAVCFVLSYVVCALSAGSLQFWHEWGWFVN